MAILKGNDQPNALTGGATADLFYGYAGNDTLDGGSGADTMRGGKGDDIYIVDNVLDVIKEDFAKGIDTVNVSIVWRQYANVTLSENVENLILTYGYSGTGNALSNIITGNAGSNILSGGDGNDTLIGGEGGGDLLNGDAGNDMLNGERGRDTLNGGAGNDTLAGWRNKDSLNGGEGNDVFRTTQFMGDSIDGGTGFKDSLQIFGSNQSIDISSANAAIKNIEFIKFANDSNNTLKVTAQGVLDLSSDSDTLTVNARGNNNLIMETGWVNGGIVSDYQVFTKDGATLKISSTIAHIKSGYTISNADTAIHVIDAFTHEVDNIFIDFGGKAYKDAGVKAIDLTGFDLEDKLLIAQHDGVLYRGTAHYRVESSRENLYFNEFVAGGTSSLSTQQDWVSWQIGATKARLISYSTHVHGSSSFDPGYNRPTNAIIQITGLPAGLPDSQFVFV